MISGSNHLSKQELRIVAVKIKNLGLADAIWMLLRLICFLFTISLGSLFCVIINDCVLELNTSIVNFCSYYRIV